MEGSIKDVGPIIATLCKGVIESAHRAGNDGVSEREAYRPFAERGVSLLQYKLFVESMARAGLVVRFGEMLRATLKGLAYAGIDGRAVVIGSPPARGKRAARPTVRRVAA